MNNAFILYQYSSTFCKSKKIHFLKKIIFLHKQKQKQKNNNDNQQVRINSRNTENSQTYFSLNHL